ncbi:MAG: aspartate/glutamate racemase family protein [Candidatus Hodarchaeales archaeon]
MKILILNPNSDLEMTRSIQTTAENFSRGEYEIVCKSTPGAPKFIETYEDEIKTAPGLLKLIRDNEDYFDAFIIACHDDPNLDVIKEITKKPVVGIGEASMKIATMLGHRFSVISTSEHSIPIKEALIRKYHLQDALASVRAPKEKTVDYSEDKIYFNVAKAAIEEDNAEVIVLGCAGLTGLDKQLEEELKVPVLDGVICSLIIATGLVNYGVSTSKIRKYNPDWNSNE